MNEIFIVRLRPSIALNIRGHERLTVTQLVDLAVRMSYESSHQKHDARRTGTSKPPGSPRNGWSPRTREEDPPREAGG